MSVSVYLWPDKFTQQSDLIDFFIGPMLPPTGAHLTPFGLIYMAALVCGLLTMIGAVIVVHHQTGKEQVH